MRRCTYPSADFMTRNTERRVEVACPVLDPKVRARVLHIISELLLDNVKARELTRDGSYRRRGQEGIPFCWPGVFPGGGHPPPMTRPQPYGGRTGGNQAFGTLEKMEGEKALILSCMGTPGKPPKGSFWRFFYNARGKCPGGEG